MRVISGTVAAMALEAAAPPQNNPRQRFCSIAVKNKKAVVMFCSDCFRLNDGFYAWRAGLPQPKGNPRQVPLTIRSGTFILTRVW